MVIIIALFLCVIVNAVNDSRSHIVHSLEVYNDLVVNDYDWDVIAAVILIIFHDIRS